MWGPQSVRPSIVETLKFSTKNHDKPRKQKEKVNEESEKKERNIREFQ